MAASVTYNFTNGTASDAEQVDTNFNDLVSYINTNAILKDGTVAFTGVVTGPATDPTLANHLTRKSYVDAKAASEAAAAASALKRVVLIGEAAATATLTASDTVTDITGATSGALALLTGDIVRIRGTFDCVINVSGAMALGVLNIGGSDQARIAPFRATDTNSRATVSQGWLYTVPSDGNYTFKLRGRSPSPTVGAQIFTDHTVIEWTVFR